MLACLCMYILTYLAVLQFVYMLFLEYASSLSDVRGTEKTQGHISNL